MRFAITGGTGFIGNHLARRLTAEGHSVVLLARRPSSAQQGVELVAADLSDTETLIRTFASCDGVAHCAGINREIGNQTYRKVHIEGTKAVMAAARRAGVRKVVLMSFLRARPNCGSPYHESKWEAEEIVRSSGVNFTILRAGMVYGPGDHLLDHLSHALYTFPLFATVGFKEKSIRPLAVEDLIKILRAALVENRLKRSTIAVTGPEELYLSEAVKRVAGVVGKTPKMISAPLWVHYVLARFLEWIMKTPMVAISQVRMLSEGIVEPALPSDALPYDLRPTLRFTDSQIRRGLPAPGPFTINDLRCCV